ncbi:peptidase S14 [Iodidimonas sp. SYSU 1G8]|uniref:peptidase S14 n=1 Tax=Iodidimonas sp. SYSU 1G8 TaxID=3133967 RepID=UPI0031FE7B30
MNTHQISRTDPDAADIDISSLLAPRIKLHGKVDDGMLHSFLSQLDAALGKDGLIGVQVFTAGGDADVGRRIADEIRLCREHRGRDLAFFGVTNVYSAGVTIMGAFPRERRYLGRDAVLLIHGRKIQEQKLPAGPLPSALQFARLKVSELENGLRLERQEFERLIVGSTLTIEALEERAATNWYVTAEEALTLKLIGGLV